MLSGYHHNILVLVSCAFILHGVQCESNSFRPIEHMKPLVDMEKDLLNLARTYLKDQKRKLAELEPFAASVREAMQLSDGEQGARYLGNPINCYLMIKRYTSGWKELPPRLDVDTASLNKVKQLLSEHEKFMPSQVDLSSTTDAMRKLVDDHGVSVSDIVEGKIEGAEGPHQYQLSVQDCLAMAQLCKTSQHYGRMKEWLVEAERLIKDATAVHRHGDVKRSVVYGLLSWVYEHEGDVANALKYTEMVLSDEPKNGEFLKKKQAYSSEIEKKLPSTETAASAQREHKSDEL